jgi:trans-aconitate 2-methyltransferase
MAMADWNAEVYARISQPQFAWGQRVLARLPLAGSEVVLDAGCGTGQLTELLAERLPRGRVIALDSSRAMLDKAAERLARFADRVKLVHADIARHVERPPVDAVFSTATFHWVRDHDLLFANLRASLEPGGHLVSQFGGGANLGRVRGRAAVLRSSAAFARFFEGFEEPWHYATAEETRDRLERIGFAEVAAWLEPAPVAFDDPDSYREFVRHVVLRDDLTRLPDDASRDAYVTSVVEAARDDDPPFELDYWRLNADGKRGGTP